MSEMAAVVIGLKVAVVLVLLAALTVAMRLMRALTGRKELTDHRPGSDWSDILGEGWRIQLPPGLAIHQRPDRPHFVQFKRAPVQFSSDILVERKKGRLLSDWMLWLQDLRAAAHFLRTTSGRGFVFINQSPDCIVYDFYLELDGAVWELLLSLHDDLADEATAFTIANTFVTTP